MKWKEERLKSKAGMPRLSAKFVGVRYVRVKGKEFPVLLNECRRNALYEEQVEDEDPDDANWWRMFGREVLGARMVALCRQESANDWPFEGLFRVEDVRFGNFLTCRFIEKVAILRLRK